MKGFRVRRDRVGRGRRGPGFSRRPAAGEGGGRAGRERAGGVRFAPAAGTAERCRTRDGSLRDVSPDCTQRDCLAPRLWEPRVGGRKQLQAVVLGKRVEAGRGRGIGGASGGPSGDLHTPVFVLFFVVHFGYRRPPRERGPIDGGQDRARQFESASGWSTVAPMRSINAAG